MSDVSPVWHAASAWASVALLDHSANLDRGADVTVTLIDHVDVAALIQADDEATRFAAAVKTLWRLDLPDAGRSAGNDACTILWSGPNQWLALPAIYDPAAIGAALAGAGAMSEQGDGRAVVEIAGPAARKVLAKGIAIDLHETVFAPGSVALTALSHVGVHIWQSDATPTYVLSVPRSMTGHIWDWLAESAAEFGFELERRASL